MYPFFLLSLFRGVLHYDPYLFSHLLPKTEKLMYYHFYSRCQAQQKNIVERWKINSEDLRNPTGEAEV